METINFSTLGTFGSVNNRSFGQVENLVQNQLELQDLKSKLTAENDQIRREIQRLQTKKYAILQGQKLEKKQFERLDIDEFDKNLKINIKSFQVQTSQKEQEMIEQELIQHVEMLKQEKNFRIEEIQQRQRRLKFQEKLTKQVIQ